MKIGKKYEKDEKSKEEKETRDSYKIQMDNITPITLGKKAITFEIDERFLPVW